MGDPIVFDACAGALLVLVSLLQDRASGKCRTIEFHMYHGRMCPEFRRVFGIEKEDFERRRRLVRDGECREVLVHGNGKVGVEEAKIACSSVRNECQENEKDEEM